MDPKKKLPRDDVSEVGEENAERPSWKLFRAVIWIVAILLVFMGFLWLAEVVGILAVLIPGGVSFFEGVFWGFLGLVGLALILALLLWNAAT